MLRFIKIALLLIALPLLGVVRFLSGNFFYSVFIRQLEQTFPAFKEADMIALVGSNLVPLLVTAALLYVFWKLSVAYGARQAVSTRAAASAVAVTPTTPPESTEIRSRLRISTGEDGGYCSTDWRSIYRFRRRLNLKIENVDPERPITEIRVLLECIDAEPHYAGPWTLASGLSLAAGDHTFVQLVSFGEAEDNPGYPTSQYDRSDSDFEFMVGGSPGNRPAFPKGSSQYFLIKVTGMGTAPCEYRGKVWVDRSDGRLRIADAEHNAQTVAEQYIPLYEAATRAYEQTRDSVGPIFADITANDPKEIILWYCYHIDGRAKLYGARPPSRVREEFKESSRCYFDIENGKVIAREKHGKGRWVDLAIKPDDLRLAIEKIRELGHAVT